MSKKRRCLKAVVYMYLPSPEDLKDLKRMAYYAVNQPWRIQLYDEYGQKTKGKMKAFVGYGHLIHALAVQYKKLTKLNR